MVLPRVAVDFFRETNVHGATTVHDTFVFATSYIGRETIFF